MVFDFVQLNWTHHKQHFFLNLIEFITNNIFSPCFCLVEAKGNERKNPYFLYFPTCFFYFRLVLRGLSSSRRCGELEARRRWGKPWRPGRSKGSTQRRRSTKHDRCVHIAVHRNILLRATLPLPSTVFSMPDRFVLSYKITTPILSCPTLSYVTLLYSTVSHPIIFYLFLPFATTLCTPHSQNVWLSEEFSVQMKWTSCLLRLSELLWIGTTGRPMFTHFTSPLWMGRSRFLNISSAKQKQRTFNLAIYGTAFLSCRRGFPPGWGFLLSRRAN